VDVAIFSLFVAVIFGPLALVLFDVALETLSDAYESWRDEFQ